MSAYAMANREQAGSCANGAEVVASRECVRCVKCPDQAADCDCAEDDKAPRQIHEEPVELRLDGFQDLFHDAQAIRSLSILRRSFVIVVRCPLPA